MPGMSEKVTVEIQDESDQSPSDEAALEDDHAEALPTSNEGTDDSLQDDSLEAKLESAENKAQENYDRLLRLSAEFDNYKKRTSREMRDMVKFANEKFVVELLGVVDNLERAIASVPEADADDPLLQGVQLTLSEVLKLLDRHNIHVVESLGKPFDPNFHQAMMQQEAEDQPPNTVIGEMQRGYTMHDRLIRPAMVVVSKARPADGDA
jgi:molecular chaperone GrpE